MPIRKFITWLIVFAVPAILLGIQCTSSSRTYASLDPKTGYVGIASCEPCHQKVYDSYIETGMGRSLYRPVQEEAIETFGPELKVYDTYAELHYLPYWKNGEMFIQEFRMEGIDTIFRRTEKVDYIVGSGHQTRSYLMQRNGFLYEMPITWYVNKKIWDLSPGYENGRNSRFSREIGEECLACHTGQFDYVEGSKNRYRKVSLGIDCERCHGPGEAHIKATEGGQLIDVGEKTDYTIVNPAKLPLDKQFGVCQQCHLQGTNVFHDDARPQDFRPGQDLSQVYDVFLKQNQNTEAFGIASHAERLQGSQCFIQSAGKLTCTTCHDPHVSISKETDSLLYINQCKTCHQSAKMPECAAPAQAQMLENGNCISCHMPSGGTSDIPHVSFHDHKIRVVDTAKQASISEIKKFVKLMCATSNPVADEVIGKAWLQYYERQEANPMFLDSAVMKLTPENKFENARITFYKGNIARALAAAERLVKAQPQNTDYLFFLGEIKEAAQKFQEAHQHYAMAYQLNPDLFEAGLKGATTLLLARQGDPAVLEEVIPLFEKLQKEKPFDPRVLANLGFVFLNLRQLNKAEKYLNQALSYDPDHAQSLENMAYLFLVKNEKDKARKYIERLKKAHPGVAAVGRLEGLLL